MSRYPVQQFRSHFWPLWYRLQFLVDLPSIARILRYRKLRQQYYKNFWKQIAENINAEIDDTDFGYFRISRNGRTTFVKQYQLMLEDHLMLDIMGNKGMTYSLLTELNMPIARHCQFSMRKLAAAKIFFGSHSPVVVKPSSGTGGGRGVTTGISTPKQLMSAARLASRFDENLIVEEQLAGSSYRLLFLNGKFIDAIRRDPPIVVGDGVNSIRQLITIENHQREHESPTKALSPLVIDKDCRNWLTENDISLSAVPKTGQIIQVKRATNENDSRGNINVTGDVNPEIIKRCGELVNMLGVKFAGVDLICRDITGPFSAENCCIGEINTTPGLHHHYLIANPESGNPVAETVLEYMFSAQIGVMEIGGSNKVGNTEASLPDQISQPQAKPVNTASKNSATKEFTHEFR